MIEQKKCPKCGIVKPNIEFSKREDRKSGLQSWCKKCDNARWMEKRYPKLKDTEKYKIRHREAQANYLKSNPHISKAHRLAREHQSEIKKDHCEHCGERENLHMHHPNHNEPLEIVTLCVKCHELEHHGVRV